jgi:hypothetical protein
MTLKMVRIPLVLPGLVVRRRAGAGMMRLFVV